MSPCLQFLKTTTAKYLCNAAIHRVRIIVKHMMLCRAMSCHTMSYHVMSCHTMSFHVISYQVMSCHVMSCYAMAHHAMSHVMSRVYPIISSVMRAFLRTSRSYIICSVCHEMLAVRRQDITCSNEEEKKSYKKAKKLYEGTTHYCNVCYRLSV